MSKTCVVKYTRKEEKVGDSERVSQAPYWKISQLLGNGLAHLGEPI